MVQNTEIIDATDSTVKLDNLSDYMVIGWDIDTTGRRLLDEICHIAGYTPKSSFNQFIMPHNDIDQIARRRHLLCTITMGRFRALKDIKANKVIHLIFILIMLIVNNLSYLAFNCSFENSVCLLYFILSF